MKRSTLTITAAIIVAAIIGLQFAQNAQLKTEIRELNKTIVEFRDSERGSSGLSALSTSKIDATPPAGKADGISDLPASGLELGVPKSPRAQLAEILAERDPMLRMNALLAFVGQLSDVAIPEALIALRQSTPDWDPDARVAAQLMLTRWGKADPDGALAYLADLDLKKAGGDAAVIISAVAAADPTRSIKWLEDPDNKLAKQPWMGQILAGSITKEWVRQDPQAALDWAMTLPKEQQSGAYGGVLGTLAATDPARASNLALGLPEGDGRRDVIGQIARAWAEDSPAEAMKWVSTLEGEEGKRATSEALGAWAQSDPEAAATYVDQVAAEERSAGMLDRVAATWARRDPERAARWLGDQPEGADKADAMGDVMWNWTVADPEAASTWLLDQPAGNSRDEGISALAKATFENDPASAVTWAANIGDEKKQQWSVGVGVNVWLDRDPEAANQWLGATDSLSPEQINGILQERAERKAREQAK
jgi:hypothetical protein